MRLYAPLHNELRYAEANRRSQSDCPYREPHLDIEPHLAILPERPPTPVKANKHRCNGTGGCALQQTLQRFSLQNCRYLHGISFRPTCFGARTRTPGWVPVQHVEMKTERFAMAYRLVLGLRLCPSGVCESVRNH